jgi:phenylacetate-CoA ligase
MDARRPDRILAGLRDFFTDRPGAARARDLFHETARAVPAYADFLRQHGIDPSGVRSPADFATLPLLHKENYHRRYPLPALCRDGRLDAADMVAVSSGSSGQPTVWPRSVLDELPVAGRFEQVMRGSFGADERSTLVVVCFALGTWVGGMYTAACCRHLAAKGYPITVATPGNDLAEILRVIPELAPHYDQVVLAGYPPFLKHVIDTGLARGVDWPAYRIRLMLAGEVFSEQWRDLMGQRAGMDRPCFDSASLYGTADGGVLGTETPMSISIRRFLAGNPAAGTELYGGSRLPTLVQYDPAVRYFETHEGTLLFTADGTTPLIRYHIADEGGLVGYDEMLAFCAKHGFEPLRDGSPELPFVYVFGRSLFTVSYYGANVYPENVTVGLEQPGISDSVTGKFVLRVAEDADQNRFLSVVVELAPDRSADPAAVAESIRVELCRLNSEFAHYVPAEAQTPHVELRPAGDPEWFPPGVKHRYTRA